MALSARIDAHGGNGYGAEIADEAARAGIPLSLACAIVEQESGFRNIFGSDPVRNPIKTRSYARPLKVTKLRYLAYRSFRKRGWGMQGVGLTQLTWYELQDAADRLGGCWHTRPQLRVAFAKLAALVGLHGERAGVAAYNGAGPAAQRYAAQVLARRDKWHKALTKEKR